MAITTSGDGQESTAAHDRKAEVIAFDDTKAGVKGLVDAGTDRIPRMFIHNNNQSDDVAEPKPAKQGLQVTIPVVDLAVSTHDGRAGVIAEIKNACEKWGFFQVTNHGIPVGVLDEMIRGVRRFFEQDVEEKKKYYSRDYSSAKFIHNCNFDLHQSRAANWRDSFQCVLSPNPPHPHEIPPVCREIITEYSDYVMKLGLKLFELLSEALGLEPNHLKDMGCAEGLLMFGHYYPKCPQPELTMGTSSHTDSGFFTVLLQDALGGLQVLNNEYGWVDVPSLPGALVINIADLLQVITNDKLKSVSHRVLARSVGPRISVACFFRLHLCQEGSAERTCGPMKELVSETNPPRYKEIVVKDYLDLRYTKGLDGPSKLEPFRLK